MSIWLNLKESEIDDYYNRVVNHRKNVFVAGKKIGVPIKQLAEHDLSKFLEVEFPFYCRHFCGDNKDHEGFLDAFNHHINNNKHHYQYWIIRSRHRDEEYDEDKKFRPMPEFYVKEMVADWMGAGKTYENTWDLNPFLNKSLDGILLNMHSRSKEHLAKELNILGYKKESKKILGF